MIIIIFNAAQMSSGNLDIYGVTKDLQKELKHCQLSLHVHNILIAFFLSLTELNRISNGNERATKDTLSYSPHGDKKFWEVLTDTLQYK